MLGSRGVLATGTVMVECAASQSSTSKDVFLLDELQRAWAALGTYVRGLLVQGRNVCIPNWGNFWLESKVIISDGTTKYLVRRIMFGINHTFAVRYGVDTTAVRTAHPSQKRNFIKVQPAELTALSGVPAHTVAVALREFFLYVGEGLFHGKCFNIHIPGVAAIVLKKDKCVVAIEEELNADLFTVDSRRWPSSIRDAALEAKERSTERSRPSSAMSRSSSHTRPRSGSSSRPQSSMLATMELRPAFVAAAPRGRLFAEISSDKPRRAPSRLGADGHQADVRPPRDGSTRRVDPFYSAGSEVCDAEPQHVESVYNLVDPAHETSGRAIAKTNACCPMHHLRYGKDGSRQVTGDPIFESVEILDHDDDNDHNQENGSDLGASPQRGAAVAGPDRDTAAGVPAVQTSQRQMPKLCPARGRIGDASAPMTIQQQSRGEEGAPAGRPVCFARDHCSVGELLYGGGRPHDDHAGSRPPVVSRRKWFGSRDEDHVKKLMTSAT